MINNKKNKVSGSFVLFISAFFKALILVLLIVGVSFGTWKLMKVFKNDGKYNKDSKLGIEVIDKYKDVEVDAMKGFEDKLKSVFPK